MPIESIPFHDNIALLFSHFAEEDHAVLLDSGKPGETPGRHAILSAWPESRVQIRDGIISHTDSDKNNHTLNNIRELEQLLSQAWNTSTSSLPFCGGWIGFASYELAYRLEPALPKPPHSPVLPEFFAGYYFWAIVQDYQTRQAFLVYDTNIRPALLDRVRRQLQQTTPDTGFQLTSAFTPSMTFKQYRQQFEQIQHYLDAGDCYQVNLAMAYRATYQGSPFSAYQHLRECVPSPHMAFLNLGQQQILSISPEQFISAQQQHIITRPIKGTAARNSDAAADRNAATQLAASAKNRAENLMIVDLLRNDLGRYCETGSIRVEKLFAIESFRNVHHLVSTISGTSRPDRSIWEIFFGCFPGGSITGAPKIRACQIIAELEQTTREIYCGSIFYASNNGRFDSSIAIRTLLCNQGNITAWAGGGIVKDSTAEEEYQECQHKIRHLLAALDTQG